MYHLNTQGRSLPREETFNHFFQALRLFTALKGRRGKALLFLDHGTSRSVGSS